MLIYATSGEFATWLGVAAPTNAANLLRSASILVHRATMTAVYDVDAVTSLPTDVDQLAAFRDATCSQVATWVALAVDPAKGAAGVKVVTSKSIGSASVSYANAQALANPAVSALADAATSLCQEALLILAQAGLLAGSSWELG